MKKTMRKSALLSSIAMLIVSAIVLTSATYAWFSSSKVVSVKELSAEVKVSTGLLISVDHGGNWGTQVDFDDADAVKAGWGAGIPDVFDPVSTANGNAWIEAIYDEDTDTLNTTEATPGEEGTFVAVPLWVTGPVGEKVKANITMTADTTTAKCLKFALLDAEGDNGDVVKSGAYTAAVAATPNDPSGFMGVSAAGVTAADGAYVTDGGANIAEVAADGGIEFTIVEGTSTDAPMMFIAYLWLEGNDVDCDMLKFDMGGEELDFAMTLEIVG